MFKVHELTHEELCKLLGRCVIFAQSVLFGKSVSSTFQTCSREAACVPSARLPFKVLMFGSTEYDSKHRLLDRFIKEVRAKHSCTPLLGPACSDSLLWEDYQHKRFILFSNFRIGPELESKLRQAASQKIPETCGQCFRSPGRFAISSS